MNIRIVDEYSKNDNLNILKEECAELITAVSHYRDRTVRRGRYAGREIDETGRFTYVVRCDDEHTC